MSDFLCASCGYVIRSDCPMRGNAEYSREPNPCVPVASEEIERLRAENAKLREAVTWRPIESAPKTPKDSTRAVELIGWCPDEASPIGGDRRTIWWEPRLRGGCWYSDRGMVEHPTMWTELPEAPR